MEEIDFHFETSSDKEEFEGFTPEDVIQSIKKGARLQQFNDDELSDILLTMMNELMLCHRLVYLNLMSLWDQQQQ